MIKSDLSHTLELAIVKVCDQRRRGVARLGRRWTAAPTDEWEAAINAANAKRVTPKQLKFVDRKVYDGGCKLNNERGHGCQGQGKRHQNSAVHAQPTKASGARLAKWSSSMGKKKSKRKKR